MSMFNTVVPPHPLASILLRAINWAQPDDPEKKYPLLGRMRYVWIDEEKNIKILLKDGPDSWSEEKEEIISQINKHETLVSVETLQRDPVYLVATFKPVMETSYERNVPVDELLENMDMFNETAGSKGWPSIYIHPFDLFDKAMDEMKNGRMSSRMEKLGENIKNMLEESDAQGELEKITKEAGVDGFEQQKVKVMMVDRNGGLEDKTEEFLSKTNGKTSGEDTK